MRRQQRWASVAACMMMAGTVFGNWEECCDVPQGINVPYLCNSECYKIYAEVDYLLWYAGQDGLSYATDMTVDNSVVGTLPSTTYSERDRFFCQKWNSGVRVALGLKPTSHSWDFLASYTYFRSHINAKPLSGVGSAIPTTPPAAASEFILTNGVVNATRLAGGVTPISTSNDSTWKLYFNQFDFEMGNEFYVANDVILRPSIGLRAIWTKQDLIQNLANPLLNGGALAKVGLVPSTNGIYAINRYNGVGATAGIDIDYSLGKGFDITGGLLGGLLWGQFKSSFSTNVTSLDPSLLPTSYLNEERQHNFYGTSFTFDVGLGIRWTAWLNNEKQLLVLKFGWEQHLFTNINNTQNSYAIAAQQESLNVNNYSTLTPDTNVQRGDLSLSGFVFGAAIIF